MGSEEGMQALSGLLHASLGDNWARRCRSWHPMLAQFTALGYLKAEQAHLNAELKLDKGLVTVNGLPLPQ